MVDSIANAVCRGENNVGGDECPTTKVKVAACLQADHPRTGERGGLSAANDMLHLAMMILWEKQRGAFREAFLEWLFSFDARVMFKMFRSTYLLLTSRNICSLGLCLGIKLSEITDPNRSVKML
eukprot:CAMPEP_0171682368 /NCGR_PEP_ID=MMETSP0991-20121206/486_1 /TAXON_ID=483369 /ORGANISM="non described non described, Strain CCMP2098" /LENGTH=123 /DNA_ID=CAMNT_0012269561 /DNA_START=255 /DNA_END=626 /DNA_ORIENTATION=+